MATGPEALLRVPPGAGTRTARLTAALRDAIRSGRLAPGSRVPASRALAHDLGISRGVVVEAYDQLIAEGLLEARRGSGTTVASTVTVLPTDGADQPAASPPAVRQPARPPGGSHRSSGGAPSPLRATDPRRATDRHPATDEHRAADWHPATGRHPVTGEQRASDPYGAALADGYGAGPQFLAPLRPGVPDLAAFPRAAWLRAYRAALAAAPDAVLGYGDPAGLAPLRAALAEYSGRVRAARCAAEDVVVTGGVAQGLAVLARVLVDAGARSVLVEDPGSPQTRDQLAAHGLAPVPLPVDADGLVTTALPTGAAARGFGAVLVTPAHQYPTGVVLGPGRRTALLSWAREHGVLVIEDDYDAEFRYDREPVGCLQGSGPDVVALATSVSKALAPGLRLGWLVVPPAYRAAVAEAKFRADLGEPALHQLAFAQLLRGGGYDRHLRKVRLRYRRRRDALAAALAEHVPRGRVTGVAAGLHLVLELESYPDEIALLDAAHHAGLGPQGLGATRFASSGPPGLVLGYAAHPEPTLVDAARRLSQLMDGDWGVTR